MSIQQLSADELGRVAGGFAARDLASTLDNFDHSVARGIGNLPDTIASGLHDTYLSAVSYPTALLGGWKLASQVYGGKATWSDRRRAMSAMRQYVMAGDTIPGAFRFGA
jgi:hypothetical protein